MNIPPEGTALLTLLRAFLSGIPAAPETFPSFVDWAFLQRLARHHRLEPLLCYGIRRCDFPEIPTWVRAEWQKQRRIAAARALSCREYSGCGRAEARPSPTPSTAAPGTAPATAVPWAWRCPLPVRCPDCVRRRPPGGQSVHAAPVGMGSVCHAPTWRGLRSRLVAAWATVMR
jgi:hypothetical protein